MTPAVKLTIDPLLRKGMAPSATETIDHYADHAYHDKHVKFATFKSAVGAAHGKQLVRRTLSEHVQAIDSDSCAPGDEDAFFVADMGEVYRQHLRWKRNLSRVKPHYGKHDRCLSPDND